MSKLVSETDVPQERESNMDYTPEDKAAFVERMLALPKIARSRTDPMGIMANIEFANSLREDFPELDQTQVGWLLARLADTSTLIALRGGDATSIAVAFSSLAVEFLDPLDVPEGIAGFMGLNAQYHEQQKAEWEAAKAEHPAGGIVGAGAAEVISNEELERWLSGEFGEGDVNIEGPVAEGHIGTPEDDES